MDTDSFIVYIKSEDIYSNIEIIKESYPNLPQIPDLPYRILIIRGFESGKTNALLNLKIYKLNSCWKFV